MRLGLDLTANEGGTSEKREREENNGDTLDVAKMESENRSLPSALVNELRVDAYNIYIFNEISTKSRSKEEPLRLLYPALSSCQARMKRTTTP